MLTHAQYKALKAWPDGAVKFHEGGGRAESPYSEITRFVVDQLIPRGYLKKISTSRPLMQQFIVTRIQPDCADAIREYEEAHNINQTKE